MTRPLRIAQVAPPLERVPPPRYGGTERIVHELVTELTRRGHEVTTYASGDSNVPGRLIATVPMALRPAGFGDDASGYFLNTVSRVLDDAHRYDLIHSHLEWFSGLLARSSTVPVVATYHGRLDFPWAAGALAEPRLHRVAISEDQARIHPGLAWHVVHNGLTLGGKAPGPRRGDDLCFVGRVAAEKGIIEAIEIARRSGRRLRIAAKVGPQTEERRYYDDVFVPALRAAGSAVEFLGEVTGEERDHLLAGSYATLMPGSWPEPFGLVAIESLGSGTPILARRIGALPEIIRDGIDGLFGDDIAQLSFQVDRLGSLDRSAIRESALDRFSAARMTDRYEALYDRVLGQIPVVAGDGLRPPVERLPGRAPVAGRAARQIAGMRVGKDPLRSVRPAAASTASDVAPPTAPTASSVAATSAAATASAVGAPDIGQRRRPS